MRCSDAWFNVVINFRLENSGMPVHQDPKDFRHELCWIIPFGDYQGANLYFPDMNLNVEFLPGDLICFNSFNLQHGVRSFQGFRGSIVFIGHENMFYQ